LDYTDGGGYHHNSKGEEKERNEMAKSDIDLFLAVNGLCLENTEEVLLTNFVGWYGANAIKKGVIDPSSTAAKKQLVVEMSKYFVDYATTSPFHPNHTTAFRLLSNLPKLKSLKLVSITSMCPVCAKFMCICV
jgi:hypothetical protein